MVSWYSFCHNDYTGADLAWPLSLGLECYACNNEVSGGACEFDAASTGITTDCSDIYDHCFTRRVEEDGRSCEL